MDNVTISNCYNCNTPLIPYRNVISAPALTVEFCGGDLPVMTSSTFVICPACGLVAQSPRMSDERIAQYYSSGLYRQTLGMTTEAMDADEKRRALDVDAWLIKRGVFPASHADIGASRGYLLQEIGADIQSGYDVNPNYAGRELGSVDNETFELVTSIHVLEHTTDPMRELEWYKTLSTKYVLIEVPGLQAQGGALRFAHLWYFPPKVLADMVKCGMEIDEIDESSNTRILAQIR